MHFSHAFLPSFASAPQAHIGPVRHPARRCISFDHLPICAGRASFRGICGAHYDGPRVPSVPGNRRVPYRAARSPFQWERVARAFLLSVQSHLRFYLFASLLALPVEPGPCPLLFAGTDRGSWSGFFLGLSHHVTVVPQRMYQCS
jgi:hypothetical protein